VFLRRKEDNGKEFALIRRTIEQRKRGSGESEKSIG
jgi:hypothetical protein